MRIYQPNEYAILLQRLTEAELECVAYCQVHNDCVADGECPLQERVADIIAAETESEVVG